MKKVLAVLVGIGLVAMMGIFVGGCGQQTPSIDTTNAQPEGLSMKGTVDTTTLDGTRGNPIPGAVVKLSGDSTTQISVTSASGEYLFINIPDGSYILITTAEGHVRNSVTVNTLKPTPYIPANNTITVEDIQLDSNPIIVSISPTPNTIITQTPTFVVSFNEAMDQSSVVPALAPSGLRAEALSGSTVPLTISWPDAKTMNITPAAPITSNETYVLDVDSINSAHDTAGYTLNTMPSASDDQALADLQNYKVVTGGVPNAPANLSITFAAQQFTSEAAGIDYMNVYTAPAPPAAVLLHWDEPTAGGAPITGYRVYVANSPSGNYSLISTLAQDNLNVALAGAASIIAALYGETSTTAIDPVTTGNYPFINTPVYFKVVAYNGDGESAAATVSAKELVGPQFTNIYALHGWTTTVLDNNYVLTKLDIADHKNVYLSINQPVDPSTITAANFTISAGLGTSILSATLLTQASSPLAVFTFNAYAIVKIVTEDDMDNTTVIKMLPGVKDLAGNPVKAAVGDTIALTLM